MSYKDSIIKTAMGLFAEKGFKETSTADIAKRIGAAESTIFHHFKNKEDLLLNILDKVRNDLIDTVDAHMKEAKFDNGRARVNGIIGLFFYLSETKKAEFLMLFRNYPYQLANVNQSCRKTIESIYNFFLKYIAEAIDRGQEDGSIRNINSQKQAMIIFAMINGIARFDLFGLMTISGYHKEIIDSCDRMLSGTQP